jgi:hypothetical protein
VEVTLRSHPLAAFPYRGKRSARWVAKEGVGHRTRDPSDRHVDWRTRCLLDAGVDERDAVRLGGGTAYDLHALLDLIDRGCPPSLAIRILAPLDAPPWE